MIYTDALYAMNSFNFSSPSINALRSLYSRLSPASHDHAVIDTDRVYKVSNVNGVPRVTRCMPKSPLRRIQVAIADARARKHARIEGTRAMLYQKFLQQEHASFSAKLAACGPMLAYAEHDRPDMGDDRTEANDLQRKHLVAQFAQHNKAIFDLFEEAKFYASVEQWQTLRTLSQTVAEWTSKQIQARCDTQTPLDESLSVALANAKSNANTIRLYATLRSAGACYTAGNLPGYAKFTSIMRAALDRENAGQDHASTDHEAMIAQAYIEFSTLAHGRETLLYMAIHASHSELSASAYIEMIKAYIRQHS